MSERLRQFASTAAEAAVSLTRGNYFDSKERGELHELKEELNSDVSLVRREAVRKVIAGMTVGKDVSALFPDILRCLQSKDLETKRLVYLYLVNYAHGNPDVALLAVNTFVRDSESKSPLIRSLALRTIGSLEIPNIVDYIDEPLRRAQRDESPMVRRTAAICIGKLFVLSHEYYEDMNLGDSLKNLLNDSDPFVASNALAVYFSCGIELPLDSQLIARLSLLLEKTGEWGIPFVLDVFLKFCPFATSDQASVILQRVQPFLFHSNAAVVIAAIRVMVNFLQRFPEFTASYDRRISSCFASLLASSPCELQYVLLRLLYGLVHQLPSLAPNLKSLYVYQGDPLFVRTSKLSLLAAMANRDNILDILSELTEYAKDVDLEFTEACVQTLGELAVRFSSSEPNVRLIVVQLLLDLARSGLGHLFQASVIALRVVYDPEADTDQLFAVLGLYLANPLLLESPESRSSLLFLCSHSPLYDNVPLDVVRSFAFLNESLTVQFALLDACFMIHSRLKANSDDRVESVLELLKYMIHLSEQSKDSMDLVERAFLLKSLLECNVDPGRSFVKLSKSPSGVHFENWFLSELGHLSTIYHEYVSDNVGSLESRSSSSSPYSSSSSDPDPEYKNRDFVTEYTV